MTIISGNTTPSGTRMMCTPEREAHLGAGRQQLVGHLPDRGGEGGQARAHRAIPPAGPSRRIVLMG